MEKDIIDNIVLNNEEQDKSDDLSLPKTTIWNLLKEVAIAKGVKPEKKLCDIISQIAIKYIQQVAKIGTKICENEGKKTLNIEHVVEALKQMGLTNYVNKLTNEDFLKQNELENCTDNSHVKQIVNHFKNKNGKKRKKAKLSEDELRQMEIEQRKLLENARIEYINQLHQNNLSNVVTKCDNAPKDDNYDADEDIFAKKKNDEDEIQFD